MIDVSVRVIDCHVVYINKNNEKLFLSLKRNSKERYPNIWQCITGGIINKEKPEQTAIRELFEETGIKNFELVKEIEGMTEYELPDYLLGKIWKGKYRGQKQKWFVVRFLGNDNEINLNTSKPEFIEWKWANLDDLPGMIVDFKKKLYEKLLPKIKLIIG